MTQPCDLVLGGGGIRGLAHVGALEALEEAGYRPHRVAGASAGAIAGALTVTGVGASHLRELFDELDFRDFAIGDLLGRLAEARGVGRVVDRVAPDRVDPLTWLTEHLGAQGVDTFADLRIDDDTIPPGRRYRLVVRCLDVAHRRVIRLPWDYHLYGLDPDRQSVARAVRASMAVPFVFDPVPIGGEGGRQGLLVDGGLTSGFPVSVLDRRDGRPPRWPTFAVRLLPRPRTNGDLPKGNVALARAVVEALLESGDAMEPTDDCDERRTIRVDVSETGPLDVTSDARDVDTLVKAGRSATERFLADWDLSRWSEACRGG